MVTGRDRPAAVGNSIDVKQSCTSPAAVNMVPACRMPQCAPAGISHAL